VSTARPYHHGNLRPELLAAAVSLIAEVGPAAFTLREVARRAGVSHNAPYRHFRDKDELLAAVAEQGFDRLNTAMLARARRESDPLARLRAAGLGYVEFAMSSPEHFLVMFDWPLLRERHPDLETAGASAFVTLTNLVEEYRRTATSAPGLSTHQAALVAWSLVHGIAKLAIADRLGFGSKAEVRWRPSRSRGLACNGPDLSHTRRWSGRA
jgi:AcrR family transcriptional regulator